MTVVHEILFKKIKEQLKFLAALFVLLQCRKYYNTKLTKMEFITLDKTPLSIITSCFNLAFSDYFVKFNATEDYLRERWFAADVDYSLSAGVMIDDQLVGFIINGVREWNGLKSAFNVGTGVIPSHRGNGLTEKMYQFLMPQFMEQEIKCLGLEVIQENIKAIYVYEKVGLKTKRGFHCFNGEIKIEQPKLDDKLEFVTIDKPDWNLFNTFLDYQPAWENNNHSIIKDFKKYSIYGVLKNNNIIAFAIIKKENGYIPQFAVAKNHRRKGIAKFLFHEISKIHPTIKINNVDSSAIPSLDFLNKIGLNNVINQFEMITYL